MRRCLGGKEPVERMLAVVVNNGSVYPRTRLGEISAETRDATRALELAP
jgi:hypothetical protein